MRPWMGVALFVASVAVATLWLAACHGPGGQYMATPTPTPGPPLLALYLDTPSEASQGDAVMLVLRVENTSGKQLQFVATEGYPYGFNVSRDGKGVWQWWEGKDVPNSLKKISMEPGETKEYRVSWGLHGSDGSLVSSGTYYVAGFFQASLSKGVRRDKVVAWSEAKVLVVVPGG
ncbi:MAG: BsuPI-related putative proteinase inhibitor [Chloroflexota bacterium]|nr:BsuPI-related putative proteinase inhibitor [Chloroflexota bacterium]